MGLNYALLRSLTARELVSALVRDGFALDRGAGSHQVYYHPDGRRVVVAFHGGGGTFRLKSLKSIIENARWTEDDLRRLKLVR